MSRDTNPNEASKLLTSQDRKDLLKIIDSGNALITILPELRKQNPNQELVRKARQYVSDIVDGESNLSLTRDQFFSPVILPLFRQEAMGAVGFVSKLVAMPDNGISTVQSAITNAERLGGKLIVAEANREFRQEGKETLGLNIGGFSGNYEALFENNDFPEAFDFPDREDLLGDPTYFRLGDSIFHIPPENISVNKVFQTTALSTIRTPGAQQHFAGRSDIRIEIELTFSNLNEIFGNASNVKKIKRDSGEEVVFGDPNCLASLVAQFRQTPFLPVLNSKLTIDYEIDAITLMSMQIGTVPGLPQALKVRLSMLAFNYKVYMPHVHFFTDAFIWPVFRWHWTNYHKSITANLIKHTIDPESNAFKHTPLGTNPNNAKLTSYWDDIASGAELLKSQWNSEISFSLVAEEALEQRKRIGALLRVQELSRAREQVADLEDALKKLRTQWIENGISDHLLTLNTQEPIIITQMSVTMENQITLMRMHDQEIAPHQFMGSQEDRIVVTLIANNDNNLITDLVNLFKNAQKYAREYRFEINDGFMTIDHPILKLLGIRYVVPQVILMDDVQGFPGWRQITMSFASFNRAERAFKDVKHVFQSDFFASDEFKKYLENNTNVESAGRSIDKELIEMALESMQTLQLYPDLQLPTFKEFSQGLLDIIKLVPEFTEQRAILVRHIKENNGFYVDPDFYMAWPLSQDKTTWVGLLQAHILDALNDAEIDGLEMTYASNFSVNPDGTNDRMTAKAIGRQKYGSIITHPHHDGLPMNEMVNSIIDTTSIGVSENARLVQETDAEARKILEEAKANATTKEERERIDKFEQHIFNARADDLKAKLDEIERFNSAALGPQPVPQSITGKIETSLGLPASTKPTPITLVAIESKTNNISIPSRAIDTYANNSVQDELQMSKIKDTIVSAAKENNIDPVVLTELFRTESNFQAHAKSPTGYVGMGQLGPAAACDASRALGGFLGAEEKAACDPNIINTFSNTGKINNQRLLNKLYDPEINIRLSAKYLGLQLKATKGDYQQALAAYNDGLGNVLSGAAFKKPTVQAYINNILGASGKFKANAQLTGGVQTKSGTHGDNNSAQMKIEIPNRSVRQILAETDTESNTVNDVIAATAPVPRYKPGKSDRAAYHDLLTYDQTGRLVLAFPTYVLQLLDEGPMIWWFKCIPIFASLNSLMDATVRMDRREPVHIATFTFANAYHSMVQGGWQDLGADYGRHVLQTTNAGANNNALGGFPAMIGDYFAWLGASYLAYLIPNREIIEYINEQRTRQWEQTAIRPGIRIHFRLGYGSNGLRLPVVFNGTVITTEVSEVVEVIAEGDGRELMNVFPTPKPDAKLKDIQLYEHRDLMVNMMMPYGAASALSEADLAQTIMGETWRQLKEFLSKSTAGQSMSLIGKGWKVVHFGRPVYPEPIMNAMKAQVNSNKRFLVQSMQETLERINAKGIPLPDQLILASVAINFDNLTFFGRTTMDLIEPLRGFYLASTDPKAYYGEIGENIYSPADVARLAKKEDTPTQEDFLRSGGHKLNMFIFNKNPWDVMTLCMQTSPNFYLQVRPFEYRSTLFFGEGYYDFRYAYHRVSSKDIQNNKEHNINVTQTSTSQVGVKDIQRIKDLTRTILNSLRMIQSTQNILISDVAMTLLANDIILKEVELQQLTNQKYKPIFNGNIDHPNTDEVRAQLEKVLMEQSLIARGRELNQTLAQNAQTAPGSTTVSNTDPNPAYINDPRFGLPVAYKIKTFSQAHIFTSGNIIANDIQVNNDLVYTDMHAVWYVSDSEPKIEPQVIDSAIFPQYRKNQVVDTRFLATKFSDPWDHAGFGIPNLFLNFLTAGIWGGIKDLINNTINGWPLSSAHRQAIKITRSLLRDSAREMYQGSLLVMGTPWAFPCDKFYLADSYVEMNGVADIKAVTHHFGFDTGFVTDITPDIACAVKGDRLWANYLVGIAAIGATVVVRNAVTTWLAHSAAKLKNTLLKAGNTLNKTKQLFQTANSAQATAIVDGFENPTTSTLSKGKDLINKFSKSGGDALNKIKGMIHIIARAKRLNTLGKMIKAGKTTTSAGKIIIQLIKAGSVVLKATAVGEAATGVGAPVAAVQFAVSLVLDILVWLVVDRIFLSIEYWQSSKYSLIIAPLNFRGREYTAGIAGHRQGTVVTLGGDDIPNASSDDFTQQIKQIREAGKQAEDEYKGKQPNTNNEELAPQGARGGTKSLPPSTSKQPADTSKPVPVKSGQYVRPGNGPTTSSFGVNRGDHIHQGIDIGVPEGSAIRAISDGYVEALGTQIGSS